MNMHSLSDVRFLSPPPFVGSRDGLLLGKNARENKWFAVLRKRGSSRAVLLVCGLPCH